MFNIYKYELDEKLLTLRNHINLKEEKLRIKRDSITIKNY